MHSIQHPCWQIQTPTFRWPQQATAAKFHTLFGETPHDRHRLVMQGMPRIIDSRDFVLGGSASCGSTTRSVRTKRWTMRRRRTCTLIPARTGPSRPDGKRCSRREAGTIARLDREAGGKKRLEIRPPAAVALETLRKRRGRTGSAPRGSFSLFERVLIRGMNDRQVQIEVTASRKSRAYFQRSVV